MGSFALPLVPPGALFDAATARPREGPVVTLPVGSLHPGVRIRLVAWTLPGEVGPFAPVEAVVRTFTIGRESIGPPGASLVPTALHELAPLPFPIAATLRRLRPGVPTFYFAFQGAPAFGVDELVSRGESLARPSASTSPLGWFGIVFEDRMELDAWAGALLLEAAMAEAGVPDSDTDRHNWVAFSRATRPEGRLIMLDHAGRRTGTAVEIRSPNFPEWQSREVREGSLVLPAGPGGPIELRLLPTAPDRRPLYALYLHEAGDGLARTVTASVTAPDALEPAAIRLPDGLRAGYLELLDLDAWLAPRPAGHALPRYHPGSRLEPLVDGEPTFRALVADLELARGPGFGLQATGLFIREFPLVDERPETTLIAIAGAVRASGGDIRLLGHKLLSFTDIQWETLKRRVAEVTTFVGFGLAGGHLFLLTAPDLYSRTCAGVTLLLGVLGTIGSTVAIGAITSMSLPTFREHVENLAEAGKPLVDRMTRDVGPGIAALSIYPAELADNPLARDGTLPLDLQSLATRFGTWHQKIQLVRRRRNAEDGAPLHVAYLGGIDLEPGHLDSPGHHGEPPTKPGNVPNWIMYPLHDVHARLTGPAAADVYRTVQERYAHHSAQPNAPALGPDVFQPPVAASLAAEVGPQGRHVVQIARTYYRPGPGGRGLSFAAQGEEGIIATLLRAVQSARLYIYIEDQYFTPNGAPDDGRTLVGALVAAARGGDEKRLVIVVPSENDQPFGHVRRQALFAELRRAWGERVVIGAPQRRPLLVGPGNYTLEGRCRLAERLSEAGTEVVLGPLVRVDPVRPPCWLWIEGELMLCTSLLERRENSIAARVLRAEEPAAAWSGSRRSHGANAPVTLAQLKGIYVHSKLMIIDDTFVSIGSANLNRRGFFHDAEINAFAIPQDLQAAEENPARQLRLLLWAEQLGLPPGLGPVLLRDPIAAFELFKRPFLGGNRFTDIDVFNLRRLSGMTTGGTATGALDSILTLGPSVVSVSGALIWGAHMRPAWNKIIDPTTDSDPAPREGPV